jgi:hypothetical protein
MPLPGRWVATTTDTRTTNTATISTNVRVRIGITSTTRCHEHAEPLLNGSCSAAVQVRMEYNEPLALSVDATDGRFGG